MEIAGRMANTQILLTIYALVGVIMRKTGIISGESRKSFISMMVNIALPCMILHSFNRTFSEEELRAAAMMVAIALGVFAFSLLVAQILWRKKPPEERSVLQFSTMFSNAGNAGLPVVSMVFGETGVFYAAVFLIPIRLIMFTYGIALYTSGTKGSWLGLLKNPTVLVVPLGLLLLLTQRVLPATLGDAVRNIGNMTSPLAMMIIGSTLADMHPREMLGAQALLLSLVRLILLPLGMLLLLYPLPIDPLAKAVTVTLTAMPVAANTAILAEQYGADYRFASKCVFISTVLSPLTTPLIMLVIERLQVL